MDSHAQQYPASQWSRIRSVPTEQLTAWRALSLAGYPDRKEAIRDLMHALYHSLPDERYLVRAFAHRMIVRMRSIAERWIPLRADTLGAIVCPSTSKYSESSSDSDEEYSWKAVFDQLRLRHASRKIPLASVFAVASLFYLSREKYLSAIDRAECAIRESCKHALAKRGRLRELDREVQLELAEILVAVILNPASDAGDEAIALPTSDAINKNGGTMKKRSTAPRERLSDQMYHWHYILALPEEILTPEFLLKEFRKANPAGGGRTLYDMAEYFDSFLPKLCAGFARDFFDKQIKPKWDEMVDRGDMMLSPELQHLVFMPEEFSDNVTGYGTKADEIHKTLMQRMSELTAESNPGLVVKDSIQLSLLRARFELGFDRPGSSLVASRKVLAKWFPRTEVGSPYYHTESLLAESFAFQLREQLIQLRSGWSCE